MHNTKTTILVIILSLNCYAQFNNGSQPVTINSIAGASYCADTSVSANTITCSTVQAFPGYLAGQSVDVLLANTVTGATTININTLGAKAVTYNGTNALTSALGLVATATARFTYDGTRFVMQGIVATSSSCPGGSAGQVQFNVSAGVCGGDSNLTWNNTTKTLAVGATLPTLVVNTTDKTVSAPAFGTRGIYGSDSITTGAYGGFGSFQNMLAQSECFTSFCHSWDLTDIDISNVLINPPMACPLCAGDNDLTSTANDAATSQDIDTAAALTGRTFTFSVWLKVPTTPVTSRLKFVSNTPTTGASQAVSVTTAWQRFTLTGTFGVDAGTHIIASITPVDGGQGLVYVFGAQLEESTFAGPYISTGNAAQPTRFWGIVHGTENTVGSVNLFGGTVFTPTPSNLPATFAYVLATGNNNTVHQGNTSFAPLMVIGWNSTVTTPNAFNVGGATVIGVLSSASGGNSNAFGESVSATGDDTFVMGAGVHDSFSTTNALANSTPRSICFGMNTALCSLVVGDAGGASSYSPISLPEAAGTGSQPACFDSTGKLFRATAGICP